MIYELMMMMARNINRYFYKEYFIKGFIKLLLNKKMEIIKG